MDARFRASDSLTPCPEEESGQIGSLRKRHDSWLGKKVLRGGANTDPFFISSNPFEANETVGFCKQGIVLADPDV